MAEGLSHLSDTVRTAALERFHLIRTSGRIQTKTYGFAVPENYPWVYEPDFDFLHGFSD